ncbi:MAG: STAS domain-containing protein, partial [Mycobacterium sp.]
AKQLVVDLSGLEFFGTAGFSALHTINVRCAGTDVAWSLVPGRAVARLLRICDPDNTLPIAEPSAARPSVYEQSRRLLELVSQSR